MRRVIDRKGWRVLYAKDLSVDRELMTTTALALMIMKVIHDISEKTLSGLILINKFSSVRYCLLIDLTLTTTVQLMPHANMRRLYSYYSHL